MKVFSSKLFFLFLGLLAVLCSSCHLNESSTGGAIDTGGKPTVVEAKQPDAGQPEVEKPGAKEPEVEQPETKQAETQQTEARQPERKPAVVEKKPEKPPVVEGPSGPSSIVANIGDYVIVKGELEKRLINELRPGPYGSGGQAEPVNAETVLKKMIAEKAMVMEARKQNHLQDEQVQASVKRFKERRLVNSLLGRYLQGRQSELVVTDSEIEARLKADPKLDRVRAKTMVQRAKVNKLLDDYYAQLYKKLNVQKVSANFPRAAQIHQRLLYRPKEARNVGWIRNSQVKDELTSEEKGVVLATYDKGKITLEDWFIALCDIVPPSRPRDLDTAAGVEKLLDRALRMPIFVTEAESLGLDKHATLVKQVTEHEDGQLLGRIQQAKYKEVEEPSEEQIIAYFNENKEAFGTPRRVKIDQIWCQDRNAALKAKAELDSGKDFEAVKQEFSLQKKGRPSDVDPGGEGMFWDELWQADPNEIVGPIKGFYSAGVKWRLVKILEKKPAEPKEYSSEMKEQVKWRLLEQQRSALLAKYRKELLEKYPHQIYADRIKDIDPLDIP